MANQKRETFVLDFPDGQTVEDILKKAEANYSRAEIDSLISRAVFLDTWNTVWEAGQDLNTILTPGTYAAPTNAIAAACINLPDGYTASGQAFKLIVEYTSTANFIRQTLIGRAGSLYARAYNVSESTFSSWEKYVISDEFAALAERVAALENGSGAQIAEYIDSTEFSYLQSVQVVNIPDGCTEIKTGSFYSDLYPCNVASVNIPESVLKINMNAFRKCIKLDDIVLPNKLQEIGQNAFSDCYSLKSLVIPASVNTIGSSAFDGCNSLMSVNIKGPITIMPKSIFRVCSALTSIDIPVGVTKIDSYAFYGCTSLSSVNIPNTVTTLEDHAFYNCTSLESIVIPSSVTSIREDLRNDGTFRNCTNLKSIVVNKPANSISGAPWGATNATVTWTG